jgi:hypothetical protein
MGGLHGKLEVSRLHTKTDLMRQGSRGPAARIEPSCA